MKIIRILIPVITLLMIGCGSKVPMADVSVAVVNDQITGDWTTVKQDTAEYLEFSIKKFNKQEYAALIYEEKKDSLGTNKETYLYRLYFIKIEETFIINAQDINSQDPNERLYHFLKYEQTSDSTIIMTSLNDIDENNIDKFERSEDLFRFIKNNIQNEKLYGDRTELIRLKKRRGL